MQESSPDPFSDDIFGIAITLLVITIGDLANYHVTAS